MRHIVANHLKKGKRFFKQQQIGWIHFLVMVLCCRWAISTPDFIKCMRANRTWLAHTFLETKMHISTQESNRSLLLEMCESLGLFVANTGFEVPVEKQQVTVYNVGSSSAATLNSTNFGQIDFLFVGREWLHKISGVASCMDMSLASHHFPVIAEIDVDLPRASKSYCYNISRPTVSLVWTSVWSHVTSFCDIFPWMHVTMWLW